MTLRDLDRVCATSRAASMRRSSTSAGPADLVAWLMSLADSDSPSARMIAASLSCSDLSTMNLERSASCCDTCFASIAREYFERAGVAAKIRLEIAPALQTLRSLPAAQSFDFAFIDADKVNYLAYYEAVLSRLSSSGLIVFDNVLWGGSIVDESNQNDDTVALRELNQRIAADQRVQAVMLSVSDGLTLVRKR